jgi:RNA recognition motif-containing protein
LKTYDQNKQITKDPNRIVSNTVFVSGFDRRRADLEDLYNFFQGKYGKVEDINWPKDSKTGRKQAYLFIEFEDSESAAKAVNDANKVNFMGAYLTVNYKIKGEQKEKEDKDCWFCFTNKINQHLVFFETDNFYLTLPKGGLVDHHLLVVPKNHIKNQVEIVSDASLAEEYKELKTKVTKWLTTSCKMDVLVFERFVPFKFEKAVHMNL